MTYWKNWKRFSAFGASAILYLIGEYLRGVWLMGTPIDFICSPYIESGKAYCGSLYLDPAFSFMSAGKILFVVGLVLLIANRQGVTKWWHMSRWYVPIVTVFIIISGPISLSPLGLLNGGSGSIEPLVWLFGLIYIIITLVIVIKAWFTKKVQAQVS